jgi:hypothetical protein
MFLRQVIEDMTANATPAYVADTFDKRTVLEMELALSKACDSLPPNLDKHEIRTFIASKIIQRVEQGERTFGGMVTAGLAAISELDPNFV